MDLYLVRHTQPDLPAGICYGRHDVSLPADFTAAAARLPGLLPAGAAIVSGEEKRCRTIAAYLASALGSTERVEPRLDELDFGQWEGRSWADIPRVQTTVWARDVWHQSPPDGETYAALHARVAGAWESLMQSQAKHLVIVGAIGPLRALIAVGLEFPAESFLRFHLDYGGIAKLSDASGGWRLEYLNR